MTTQRTSRALARETAGLVLTAFGVLGVLLALGALHWAAALAASMAGVLTSGILNKPRPDAPKWLHALRLGMCAVGYGGLTGCAFVACAPLGWIGVSLALAGAGMWLGTRDETEGA